MLGRRSVAFGSALGLVLLAASTGILVVQAGGAPAPAPAAVTVSASPHTRAPSHPAPSAGIPTVAGPIAGPDLPSLFSNYPLSKVGYSESEFFFSGTATAYASVTALTPDGKWKVQPASSAPYKSRLVVVRPTDPRKFSGTVVVEWFNVTSGSDASVDWSFGHDEMIRSGDAYVGVSAQAAGLNTAKAADPARYASLTHPGDSYSYDMYSQAGMAVRKLAPTVLRGLRPRLVIADGESQSAIFMTTYVNAVAPLVNVFDGYLIHSRSGGSAPLSEAPQPAVPTPATVFVRTDLTVPVLTLLSETDVLGVLDFYPARQPDTRFLRFWEVAGTSHVDSYVSLQAGDDDNAWGSDLAQFASMSSPVGSLSVSLPSGPLVLQCPAPFNAGEHHYVFDTALHDLTAWAATGVAPHPMPRLEVDTSKAVPSYKLDRNGNVLGGIRTPAVDAPVATLSGLAAAGAPQFCIFFGQTHPLTPSQLSALYPTHEVFARAWQRAVDRDERAGYLLPADARKLATTVSGDGRH